ncbi:MAG: outer membrane protein OmpA-like peptidoglycan-associated protein [Paracoccaceae bacterium]|jgi:outer membrane protein OmpA-like peptidoglycan-associated protein
MTLSKFALAFAATSVLALGACDEMTDPNNPNRNTQQGAAIGAGLGALVGIATADSNADRRRGAVLGAVIGGGLGALGGASLDRQEAELRDTMGGNVGIINTGEQLIVTLPQDILFATDSSTLTGTMRGDLSALAASMNRYPDTTINVLGHTDNVGDAGYNQGLSARRAQAVTSVLINASVAPSRIRSIGRGEDAPIATNLTAAGRQQNRRVEIIIVPN